MPTSSDFLQPRLDAPDHSTRMIQLKRAQDKPMNHRDLGRLATRMSVEEETQRAGGTVQKMLPREQDPGAAYQKGYEGTRRLFSQPSSGAAPRTGLAPVASGNPAAATPITSLRRVAPSANIGGKSYPATQGAQPSASIGGADYAPTAAPGDDPDNMAPAAPPSTRAVPATPTTSAAPQTESNNPLSGDTNRVPGGATTSVNPAGAAGFSQRGAAVPAGDDELTGGRGIFARKFSSPQSAGIYGDYVRRLFGNEPEIA